MGWWDPLERPAVRWIQSLESPKDQSNNPQIGLWPVPFHLKFGQASDIFFLFLKKFYLFIIYFWLYWVFVAARIFSLVVVLRLLIVVASLVAELGLLGAWIR